MMVGTEQMRTEGHVKYPGVTLDMKLTFWPDIKLSAEKAAVKTNSLSHLVAHTYGPRQGKRYPLISTTHSIMLYGA